MYRNVSRSSKIFIFIGCFFLWVSPGLAQPWNDFGTVSLLFNPDSGCDPFSPLDADAFNWNFPWEKTHGSPTINPAHCDNSLSTVTLEAQLAEVNPGQWEAHGEGIRFPLELQGYGLLPTATYEMTIFYYVANSIPTHSSGLSVRLSDNPQSDIDFECVLDPNESWAGQSIYLDSQIGPSPGCGNMAGTMESLTFQFSANSSYDYLWITSWLWESAIEGDGPTGISISRVDLSAIAPPPDTDGDGVWDYADSCLELPGPACTNGCPDTDGDCLADSGDACVSEPGPQCTQGCPDPDGDCVAGGFDGLSLLCNNEAFLFDYVGLPAGWSLEWAVGPGLDIVAQVGNSLEVMAQPSFKGSSSVTATVEGEDVVNTFWIGAPKNPVGGLFGPSVVKRSALPLYAIMPIQGATTYNWLLPYPFVVDPFAEAWPKNWKLISHGGSQITAQVGEHDGLVQVSGENACGETGVKWLNVSVSQQGGGGPIP